MSHELDITDGIASFATAKIDAWHVLGQTLEDTFTAEEAMEHAHLGGWDVRKIPVFAKEPGSDAIEIPNRKAVARTNPINKATEVFTTVSDAYTIIQNEEHAEFLNTLVDESGAHFETAGALYGGRQVFITMKLPGHMLIGGKDQVDTYIAAINSHDGSKSFTLMATPVRIVCANTLQMAFGDHSHIYRVRHTSGATQHVQEARQALDLTFDYLEDFQIAADQLINTTLTDVRFEEILRAEFAIKDEDARPSTIARAEGKIEDILSLFAEANTHEGVRNTAWAGLNAMTEWWDHFSPVRGDDKLATRSLNAVFDVTFKNRALDLMMATV